MLTVSLLRHAKSSWADTNLKDFERPLAERGVSAALNIGAFMAGRGIQPELILCSSSKRTRETLDMALEAFSGKPKVMYEDSLYHASSGAMLAMLRSLPSALRHVMIVGHNPGLHALALDLFGTGERDLMVSISRKFPTTALAGITFPVEEWRWLQVGEGQLALFVTPKTLQRS